MNQVNLQTDSRAGLYASLLSGEFLDKISMGVIVIDSGGSLIDCNKATELLLGSPRDQLIGSTPYNNPLGAVRVDGSPFPANDFPSVRVLASGEPQLGAIMGVHHPGRSRRWLWVDSYPLVIDGRVEGAATCLQDISVQRQHRHLLELNNEVNQVLLSVDHDDDSLQALCDALVAHGPYALAWIGMPSTGDEGAIDVAFSSGITDYPIDGMVSSSGSKESGRGPVGTAFRTGTTQVVDDLTSDELFEPWRTRAAQFGLGSCVAIPFSPSGRRAVLAIYDRHSSAFDEMTVRGLETLARASELGIAHVQSLARLSVALDGTLAALGQMTETRDPYTAGHQRNVGSLGASLAESIASAYGLDAPMVRLIRQSGDVHDIGKIAVPSEILTRPGRLSAIEYEMVKRHTLVGYDILSRASLPWPIAEVALQHHERMNGSGYPHGLTGDKIILPARIVAVADVVEAMTQHRPYRPGLGIDKALAEVTAGAGQLFDAEVVAACLAVFEAGFTFESQRSSQPTFDFEIHDADS